MKNNASLNSKANSKENKKSKPSIISTSIDLFKFYLFNNFKNLSNNIYSLYLGSRLNFSRNPKLQNNINTNNILETTKIIINKENINNKNIIQKDDEIEINNNLKELNFNKENQKENKLLIFNNSKTKKFIYNFLENELKINNTKLELRNCNNNQILQINKYKEFKNKTIIFFYASIIILKYYNIISITYLCVISLMKNIKIGRIYSNIVINSHQINLLIDDLWNISNQTTKNIFSSLLEIIHNSIDKIAINKKFNKNQFLDLITNINNEIRDKCNYFIYLIKLIKENINNLENQYFDENLIENNIFSEYKLRFFYIFCDIICSDMFYSSFVESYEEEIKIQIEGIMECFDKQNEKTFTAIVFDFDSHKNNQFLNNEQNIGNKDEINEKEEKDNILMNYQNCLQSIDI